MRCNGHPPVDAFSIMQRVLAGRYRLRDVLGRGGTATVWRADDLRLERPVAVKTLDASVLAEPGTRERLGREARTLARMAHPNIVAVHDYELDAEFPVGAAYLVMEFVEGPSLATLLRQGPLAVDRALAIAGQLCAALVAAHGAGVLHRDIKPGNVLLTPGGTVKVCDFGLARAAGTGTVTDGALVMGTSAYLAPERAAGGTGDARADLYALGCVLYEMLSGAPPFPGRNPVTVAYRHVHDEVPPLVDVPEPVDRLVRDLLAKDPADRPASAAEVGTRIAALTAPAPPAGDEPATIAQPTQVFDLPRRHRRGGDRVWWALIAVAALAALGGIVALLPQDGTPPATMHSAPDPPPAVASLAPQPAAPPSQGRTASAAPTGTAGSGSPAGSPPARTPTDQIAALRTAIGQQAAAGQLDPAAGANLSDMLADVARRLDKGQVKQAATRVSDLRGQLGTLVRQGKVTGGAFQVLSAGVDRLAYSIGP